MAYPVMPLGFIGSQGDNDTYRIERSLRFNSADSAYVSKTYASGTAPTTFTISCWIKRSSLSTTSSVFASRSGNTVVQLEFASDDKLSFVGTNSGGSITMNIKTSDMFRDVAAWYHLVLSVDTAQATDSNRVKIYVNGSQITSFTTSTYPPQNSTYATFGATEHSLGERLLVGSGVDSYFSGYLTETIGVDGQALTPSSFGETDAITGRWKAKAYSGTYGTNGFYLKFADNSGTTSTTLGKDSSPNGNNWTPNNFSVTAGAGSDSLVDSPTNYGSDAGVGGEVRGNYCTMNPLSNNGGTVTDGNLDFYGVSSFRFAGGTIAVSSGKWYMEATKFGASTGNTESNVYTFFGFIKPSTSIAAGNSQLSYTSSVIGISDSGWAYNFAAGSSATTGFGSGDVASIAIDFTTGSYNIRKNNTSVASGTMAFTGELIPAIFSYASSNRFQPNFGQRPFAYTAPTGFKALCTTNLTTPTIKKPSSYFDVVTRTSDGASNYTKTGLGFSPDLIWTKDRTSAYDHVLWDTARGAIKYLNSNTTSTELTAGQLASFNSDGYTINYGMGQANFSTDRYVDWIWKAGSSSVTNNSGSITSTVRADPLAGFSVCTFNVGASGAKTFGHGLNTAPRMVIVKSRTSALGWTTYHASVITATNQYIQLNTTSAILSVAGIWGSALPTSSVVGIGSGTNVNANDDCVAYCFAEVDGYSKIGSYIGNGSADGTFVYCGFRPRWVMLKRTDSTSNWYIYDSARNTVNVVNLELYPDGNFVETNGGDTIDLISSGFKIRTNQAAKNALNGTWIFAAFAESPFKYARAR